MEHDESTKFISSLSKFLRSLCNGYIDFDSNVELIGHIYLSVDTGKKFDYVLNEKVCKSDTNIVTFLSNSFHAQPAETPKSESKPIIHLAQNVNMKDQILEVDSEGVLSEPQVPAERTIEDNIFEVDSQGVISEPQVPAERTIEDYIFEVDSQGVISEPQVPADRTITGKLRRIIIKNLQSRTQHLETMPSAAFSKPDSSPALNKSENESHDHGLYVKSDTSHSLLPSSSSSDSIMGQPQGLASGSSESIVSQTPQEEVTVTTAVANPNTVAEEDTGVEPSLDTLVMLAKGMEFVPFFSQVEEQEEDESVLTETQSGNVRSVKGSTKTSHQGITSNYCPHCKKEIKVTCKNDMNRHMMKHVTDKPYMCTVCKETFSRVNDMNIHMKLHSEAKHKCTICDKNFPTSTILKKHVMEHTGGRPHQCPVCKKSFTRAYHMREHMQIHTGEKRHTCSFCQRKFIQASALKKHIMTHTVKKHVCAICSGAFGHAHELKIHMRLHTGEKVHECSLCKKPFSLFSSLKKHMMIHTGEKPHECSYCKRRFRSLHDIKCHVVTHTGERAYKCSFCEKAFGTAAGRKQHIFSMHTTNNDVSLSK